MLPTDRPAAPSRPRAGHTFLAGLAIAGLLVPEAVAYAAIAGVPPAHALVAALVGLLVYPFIGTSRFATLSVTSSAAAIFASVVAAEGTGGAFALVGVTGGLFIVAALARADFLAAFVSRPVLRGFAWALAARRACWCCGRTNRCSLPMPRPWRISWPRTQEPRACAPWC